MWKLVWSTLSIDHIISEFIHKQVLEAISFLDPNDLDDYFTNDIVAINTGTTIWEAPLLKVEQLKSHDYTILIIIICIILFSV